MVPVPLPHICWLTPMKEQAVVAKVATPHAGAAREWALQLRNDKGVVLAADDVLPCNLAGTPNALVQITYTPA